jgi:hypothetical protein
MKRLTIKTFRPVLMGTTLGGLAILISGGMFLSTQQKQTDFKPVGVLGPLPTITQFPVKPVNQVDVEGCRSPWASRPIPASGPGGAASSIRDGGSSRSGWRVD